MCIEQSRSFGIICNVPYFLVTSTTWTNIFASLTIPPLNYAFFDTAYLTSCDLPKQLLNAGPVPTAQTRLAAVADATRLPAVPYYKGPPLQSNLISIIPMYPYLFNYRRGPSRVVWFILGGVFTALWFRHKEFPDNYHYVGHCVRRAVQAPPTQQNNSAPPHPRAADTGDDAGGLNSRPPTASPPQASWNPGQQPPLGWEEEKQRMLALGRQAGDTVSVFSRRRFES